MVVGGGVFLRMTPAALAHLPYRASPGSWYHQLILQICPGLPGLGGLGLSAEPQLKGNPSS